MTAASTSIDPVLQAITAGAEIFRARKEVQELAHKLTGSKRYVSDKIQTFVDELHRRFVYAPNPIQSEYVRMPFAQGEMIDVDDACLFVMALASSVGIRSRLVGVEFGRGHWTCFVAYEDEEHYWMIVDPLRQAFGRTLPAVTAQNWTSPILEPVSS